MAEEEDDESTFVPDIEDMAQQAAFLSSSSFEASRSSLSLPENEQQQQQHSEGDSCGFQKVRKRKREKKRVLFFSPFFELLSIYIYSPFFFLLPSLFSLRTKP